MVECRSPSPAASRFLESQPISGVFADRHLFSSQAVAPAFVAPQRNELLRSRPAFLIDGLGPYNRNLALASQAYLRAWLADYREVARTGFSIIYRNRGQQRICPFPLGLFAALL
jgi:hypothetical protein